MKSIWKIHVNIYVLSFMKWPENFKGQFGGHIWSWKYVMNIQSSLAFVKWCAESIFDAWLLTLLKEQEKIHDSSIMKWPDDFKDWSRGQI